MSINKLGLVLWGTKNIYKILELTRNENNDYSISTSLNDSIECRLKGKRGVQGNTNTYLLAGDKVEFIPTDEKQGIIVNRLERSNGIIRRKHSKLQPVTVNIDALVIVSSFSQPSFLPHFIDRMIYLALNEQVPIILVLNKLDLLVQDESPNKSSDAQYKEALKALPEELLEYLNIYSELDIHVVCISTLNHWGIEELDTLLNTIPRLTKLDRPVLSIVGQSGVGKSSLINCLMPQANRATGIVSVKYNRGRHVTTKPEMLFSKEKVLVDTPGIKDLFPSHFNIPTLYRTFPDVVQYADACKLSNCSHRDEPKCGVINRIEDGILQSRYDSYVKLRNSLDEFEKTKWSIQKF